MNSARTVRAEHEEPALSDHAALVLSGGGITGFLFEIGVLAAIEDTECPSNAVHKKTERAGREAVTHGIH